MPDPWAAAVRAVINVEVYVVRWYLRHWYNVGLLVAVLALASGVVIDLNRLQQILLLSFALLLLHEFEEYGWPGGGVTFMNTVMRPSKEPDRYPLNQLNSMVVNVPIGYVFWGLPIFFPHVIWIGLAPILFGFGEVLLHAAAPAIKAKALYNPGLFTAIPWLVLGIWYISEASSQGALHASTWWLAIGYMLFISVFGIGLLGYVVLASHHSPFPFDDEELARFEKYRRFVHAAVHPHPQADGVGPIAS